MSDFEIDSADIISEGFVRLYRQPTDRPFTPENIMNIETDITSLPRFHTAVTTVFKQESQLAARTPFAWNPEFGYVTARPEFCGTGLEISALFHLEAINLIGDLDPVLNALAGLRMSAWGFCNDGLRNAAHLFRVTNLHHLGIDERDLASRVGRVFTDLVQQETNARIRLVEELPRLFEDAIARALAVLRSCRLLSEWELLDIVSPLRLAANLGFLDGLSRNEAKALMEKRLSLIPSAGSTSYEEQQERDRQDAILADKVNKRFKGVRLNAFAKEWLT